VIRSFAIVIALLGASLGNVAHAEVKVVATVPGLAAIAKEVAGSHASVKSLTRSTQDPHFVDARPSLALDLNRADLLLVVGLELEVGWLPTLLAGARNPNIMPGSRGYFDASQMVSLKEVHRHPVSRSEGDIHPAGNPHYLADPRSGAEVAKGIAARLCQIDPTHQGDYQTSLLVFLKKLDIARAGWERRFAPLKGAPVVAYHRTWVYVASWMGLKEVGYLEPKPGIPPNPSHVAQLLVAAKENNVRAILQEEYYPDSTSKLLASKIPAQLVRVPGGPDFQGGQSYLDYVDRLVSLIEAGLKPRGS
jgi:zinc/manganese transport system substrate-binding protein